MPSRPTIPRRNSGNRATPVLTNENDKKLYSDDDINIYKNEVVSNPPLKLCSQLAYSVFVFQHLSMYNDPNRKYDSMPALRTSAKNRKQLDKLFSNENTYGNINKISLKNNEFLNTPRTHSPDPYSESGVFSLLSENDHK
jgi:hypothetical protein